MTLQEIRARYFPDLDPGDGRTLHEILHEGAGRLIADLPDQAEFPSERRLAETLKVHRNTLRGALEPYIRSGRLKRNRRRTLVHHGSDGRSYAPEDEIPHPLQLRGLVPNPAMHTRPVTVRTVIYETHPAQKQFWQEAISSFEQAHPAVRIDLKTTGCLSFDSYRAMIREDVPDLFQLPVPFSEHVSSFRPLLGEVPEDLFPEALFFRTFYEEIPQSDLRCLCPLAFPPWLDLVNLELAQRHRIDLDEFASGKGLFSFASCAERLPRDLHLSLHFGALINTLGLPVSCTEDSIRSLSEEIVKLGKNLLPRGEDALLLKLDQPFTWYHREVSHAFLSGNLVQESCPFPLRVRALRKEAPFRTELFFQCTTLPQRRIYSGAIEFGIHAESSRREESLLFLRHLLSEPVQARLLDLTGNLPFRRSVLEEFAARNESFRNLYAHISCFRAIPERIMNTFWSGKYSNNATVLSILREHADPVPAAKANADKFFRVFPEYHKQNTIKQKH